jgi:hypothetical protein
MPHIQYRMKIKATSFTCLSRKLHEVISQETVTVNKVITPSIRVVTEKYSQ